jgi:sensor histidine kinase regulating citrate/malate metabolism
MVPICEIMILEVMVTYTIYIGTTSVWILCFVCTVLCGISLIFLFLGMRRLIETTKSETRYNWLKAHQKLQTEYSEVLETQLHEARKLRHDMLNYTQTLDLLLEEGHYQEVKNCTKGLQTDLLSAPRLVYCGNPVVNAILFHKLNQAREHRISVEVNLVIQLNCGIETADLIGIFSNLLDNALEACCKTNQPWISLSDRHNGELYTVTMRNSKPNETLKYANGKLITQKADWENHGIGLEILEQIARRYGGSLIVHDEGESFTTHVLMQLPQNVDGKKPV